MNRAMVGMAMMTMLLGTASLDAKQAGPRGPVTEGAFQVRVGAFLPDGGGDVWRDNEELFTLDSSDFNDLTLGFTYLHPISNGLEVGVNIDFYNKAVQSQYRFDCAPGIQCVDAAGFPILHDTELSRVPLTFDVRFVPGGRYRLRGPRRILKPVFYVGAGAGVNFWEYEEVGDFLDFTFDPPEIFPDRFQESGTALEAHLLAGVELPMGRSTNLLIEGRHSWSDDELGGDFAGFGTLEMGGTSVFGGVSIRF